MLIPTFILPYSFYFMAVAFILPAALNGARFLTSVHADPLVQPLGVFPIMLLTAGFRLLLPDAANSHKVLNFICVTDSGIYSYTPAIVHINAHIADILWEIFYGTVSKNGKTSFPGSMDSLDGFISSISFPDQIYKLVNS